MQKAAAEEKILILAVSEFTIQFFLWHFYYKPVKHFPLWVSFLRLWFFFLSKASGEGNVRREKLLCCNTNVIEAARYMNLMDDVRIGPRLKGKLLCCLQSFLFSLVLYCRNMRIARNGNWKWVIDFNVIKLLEKNEWRKWSECCKAESNGGKWNGCRHIALFLKMTLSNSLPFIYFSIKRSFPSLQARNWPLIWLKDGQMSFFLNLVIVGKDFIVNGREIKRLSAVETWKFKTRTFTYLASSNSTFRLLKS